MKNVSFLAAVFLCLAVAAPVMAQEEPPQAGQAYGDEWQPPQQESAAPQGAGPYAEDHIAPPPAPQPPEAALQACDGRLEGDSCDFYGPKGEAVQGTCGGPPDAKLACVPVEFDQNNSPKVR